MPSISQIRKIHTLKNILGLEDDLYIEMLMSFGVQTSKDLTFTEAAILLDILEDKAIAMNKWVKAPKKYKDLKRNDEMASDAQLRMIEGIWRELSYFDDDKYAKKSLRKFLKTKFRTDDIMFLTKHKAAKVIQALQIIKNKVKRSVATLTNVEDKGEKNGNNNAK